MQLTFLHGYPDYVGKRFNFAGYGNGPVSYVATGDPLYMPRFNNYIDLVYSAISVSGLYNVRPFPQSYGARAAWNLVWGYISGAVNSITTATAGSGQTPGTYLVPATGGNGAGAVASIVVAAGGTVTAAPVIVKAGIGYTAPPTFTLAAGGTPATFTATLSTAGPVPAGTNLSLEVIQIGGFGGVY